MNLDATKAGRRHSTADSAILQGMHGAMKAHRKARAEHDAEMDDYMKALGIEPPPDEPADDSEAPADDAAPDAKAGPPKKGVNPFAKKPAEDDSATKDIDLVTLADMVEDAIVEAVDEMGLWGDGDNDADDHAPDAPYLDDTDEDDEDDAHHVYVYPKFAVACTANGDYQIPYTIEAGAVVIAVPGEWQRVEKLWKAIPGAAAPQALQGEAPQMSDDLPQAHVIGGAVKMMDDGSIVAQAIAYGDAEHPDMSAYSDFFTKSTDLWLDQWTTRPMLYHHGQDEGTKDAPIIGQWVKAWKDDAGVWMQGQLDKSHRYAAAIKELTRRGLLRISTDSMPHLVRREAQPNGTNEIKVWPIGAASLTPTAAEPRLMTAEIKALMADLGLPIATTRAESDATRESADGQKAQGTSDLELAAAEIELLLLMEETL